MTEKGSDFSSGPICELPPEVRAVSTLPDGNALLVFGVSHNRNYTFVWDGVSRHPQEMYWEPKHEDDLYAEYRPAAPKKEDTPATSSESTPSTV